MIVKYIKILDRGVSIPAAVMKAAYSNEEQRQILRDADLHSNSILLMNLVDKVVKSDPIHWFTRTMTTAHKHLNENFDLIKDGEVIDVEFILGETTMKRTWESKKS
jgi:hypothetical protein